MNLSAWAEQRARYSRARRGRHERGATVAECALVAGAAQALGLRAGTWQATEAAATVASAAPAPVQAPAAA
jgi:hypothetical protein